MPSLAILVPSDGAPPPPPELLPLGVAALALARDGVEVVFGDRVVSGRVGGLVAQPGGWRAVEPRPVLAVWDRYPGQSRPSAWAAAIRALGAVPIANPPRFDDLCRDKLACQEALADQGFPTVVSDPDAFPHTLAQFGAGFLKPRYGSFGHGVRRVHPGDDLPASVAGLTGALEPSILQRAVPPPDGFAAVAVRVMVQRDPTGAFAAAEPIVRWSVDDPVANAARGAQVSRLVERFPDSAAPAVSRSLSIAQALAVGPDADCIVEMGIDLVLGPDGAPHPIEVNGKPRGRLTHLASADPRFSAARDALAEGPLRWLVQRFATGAW